MIADSAPAADNNVGFPPPVRNAGWVPVKSRRRSTTGSGRYRCRAARSATVVPAQSQSKTKIVNLDALKQAKYADKIEKQKASIKHRNKLITFALISAGIIAAAITTATTIYILKHKKSS